MNNTMIRHVPKHETSIRLPALQSANGFRCGAYADWLDEYGLHGESIRWRRRMNRIAVSFSSVELGTPYCHVYLPTYEQIERIKSGGGYVVGQCHPQDYSVRVYDILIYSAVTPHIYTCIVCAYDTITCSITVMK